MTTSAPDPYAILGVAPSASDDAVRTAYRKLAQRHHPDHNQGSHESAVRFAAIQEAYARVKVLRTTAVRDAAPSSDPALDDRLAAMENDVRAARAAREKAMREAERAAREARRARESEQASDEELGYVSTDDSFSKIFDDFADQVSSRFTEAQGLAREARDAREAHAGERERGKPRSLTDWIDELGAKLTGEHDKPGE